jgi:DnaJ domain
MTKPHEVLGVDPNAGEATIKAAFRKAAKKYHPDLLGGDRTQERRLGRLIAARDFLINHTRRSRWFIGDGLHPLRLPAPARDQSFVYAGALMGAGIVLFLFFMSAPWESQGASIPPFDTATVSTEAEDIPDAGSAELKAIRDLREAVNPNRAADKTAWRVPPGLTFREGPAQARSIARPTPGRLQQAASQISRTWRKLAEKLRGI